MEARQISHHVFFILLAAAVRSQVNPGKILQIFILHTHVLHSQSGWGLNILLKDTRHIGRWLNARAGQTINDRMS